MADFVTSISTISGLRSWWDSTIPSTVPSGDNYIAELDAGAYDLSAVSTTWGGKTVASGGQIIIRPATAAKITTVTRALRYQADGVHFSVPNSDVTFTTFRVTLEGLQLNGGSAGASVVLTAYSTFSKCILSNAKPAFGDIGNAIKDSVSLRDIDGSPAMYLGIAGIAENCTFIHFGTEPGLRVNSVSTVKNCAIVSIGGTSAADGSGTWDTGSTNNAFGSGTTYGASPITFTASAEFENITSLATADLRLKSGASLATAGASGVGTGADVYWQTRTASYSVGAYELDAGGGTPSLVVSDGAHAHAADNLALTIIGTLSIADATHAHAADSITITAMSNGTITIPAVRDWGTKALKTGQTGVQVDIRNITTGALVVRKTGQTTHATTGVCVVTDAAIVAGTTYEVVTRFADGSRGMWDYTAS